MDPATWHAILVALIPSVTTMLSAFIVGKQVTQIHLLVNSKMAELLQTTKDAAHAEGVTAGMAAKTAEMTSATATARAEDRADKAASAVISSSTSTSTP